MDYNPYHKESFNINDYLRAFIWGLIFSVVAFVFQLYRAPNRDILINISNAFLFGGGVQLVYATFSFINKEGFFDVAIVGFKQIGAAIDSGLRGRQGMKDVPDLQSYKEEKMKTRRVNWPCLSSGAFYFLLSVIVAFIFSTLT